MSAISGIASSTYTYQKSVNQFVQDFQAIGTALQSGNLAGAQGALNTFQQYLQANSTASATQPFGKNGSANTDYQNLVTALQSGNLTSAQQAYSSLQTDLKAVGKGHHHHHHGSNSASQNTAANNLATTPANNLLIGDNSTGLNTVA